MSLAKVAEHLRRSNSFLITAHVNLEGDALGSELALYRLLKKMGKSVCVVNADRSIPYGYEFLPDISAVWVYKHGMKNVSFDSFVVVDCSDVHRTGDVYKLNIERKPVVNIDHHISNVSFGDVNWVDPHACSCSEMIYHLYKTFKVPLDKESALLLYVGLMTDSGSFRYSNTTSKTHVIAAELMKFGLDVNGIYRFIFGSIPYKDMRLLAGILPTMRREASGKILWYEIPSSLFSSRKLSIDLSEHILSFARSIQGVEVVALFKENRGSRNEIRINLRSQGRVDVNRIAQAFGGGGHRAASGATIPGALHDVRRRVVAAIKKSLK
jgi:bifunctional oligoribonuclease and PAP phosphatase NrnA